MLPREPAAGSLSPAPQPVTAFVAYNTQHIRARSSFALVMDQNALSAIHYWDLPKILLVSAMVFALVAAGFFLGVFFQLSGGRTSSDMSQGSTGSLQEKQRVLNQLSGGVSGDGAEGVANTTDSDAANVEAKLKILRSLNAN